MLQNELNKVQGVKLPPIKGPSPGMGDMNNDPRFAGYDNLGMKKRPATYGAPQYGVYNYSEPKKDVKPSKPYGYGYDKAGKGPYDDYRFKII